MPKSDFIPRTDSDFLVWHDQFKTAVLAQAATADWSGGVLESWSNAPARWLPNNTIIQKSITPMLAALGSLLGIDGPQDTTDLTTSKPTLTGIDLARRDGVVELDFDKSISDGVPPCGIYAKRDGDADFVFLARDTAIDKRLPALHSLGGGGREYKAVYVQSDAEIGLFSDEVVVNCAP